MIKTYVRKQPLKIQAVQWTGDNIEEIQDFFGLSDKPNATDWAWSGNEIVIGPRKGDMIASIGDFLILTDHGEIFPCKSDIFEAMYEEVEG